MKTNLVAVPLATLMLVLSFASVSQATGDGKAIFEANKCNLCHSIDSQGITKKSEKMEGAELSDVGNRLESADWLKAFIKQEETKEGEKHKKKYKGTDEELDTLANWIMSLKQESPDPQ
jgi:mono/diheme cytochrome c family protein